MKVTVCLLMAVWMGVGVSGAFSQTTQPGVFNVLDYKLGADRDLSGPFERIVSLNQKGTIYVPPGKYTLSKTLNLPLGYMLRGDSFVNTSVQYTGDDYAIVIKGILPALSEEYCQVEGFSLTGNSKAKGGILITKTYGHLLTKLSISGFENGCGVGFLNQEGAWVECNTLDMLRIGGCKVNIHFFHNPQNDGTDSFGYNRIQSTIMSVGKDQIGIYIESSDKVGSDLYNAWVDVNMWLQDASAVGIKIKGRLRTSFIRFVGEDFHRGATGIWVTPGSELGGCAGFIHLDGKVKKRIEGRIVGKELSFNLFDPGTPVAAAEAKPARKNIKKLLIIGNSITQHSPSKELDWSLDNGMAATCPENDFAHILYSKISAVQPNLKPRLQLGHIKDEPHMQGYEEFLKNDADLVIIELGDNFKGELTVDGFRKPYEKMVAALKKPNRRILCLSSWGGSEINKLIAQAAINQGVTYIDIGYLNANPANRASAEGNFTHSGVNWHPGNAGMQAIADEIWKVLE